MTASFDPLEEVRKRRLILNRLDAWLFEEMAPYLGQRILEVRCGHGNLVRHLLDRELIVATDKDPASVDVVRGRFGSCGNVRAFVYDINDRPPDNLNELAVDTIVSLNVLEHIENDVRALRHMHQWLRAGGRLVLVAPAHQWLYGTMDASIAHYRRYDKRMMREMLQSVGFTVERQVYINALGTLGWFVNGRLLRHPVPPSGQLRWFNVLVPFLIWMERRVRPPWGLSLLSVATREAHSLASVEA